MALFTKAEPPKTTTQRAKNVFDLGRRLKQKAA